MRMRVIDLPHLRDCCSRIVAEVCADDCSRKSFSEAIARLRGYPSPQAEGICIHFSDSQISSLCNENGIFIDASDMTSEAQISLERLFSEALELIEQSDPRLSELIQLVTTDVVFMNSNRIGGGTASHLPGIACFSPGDNWLAYDMAESLIHEAVHLSTFLCDMVHSIFTEPASAFEKEECQVLSAVKK